MDDDVFHWTWYHWAALAVSCGLWAAIWYGAGALLYFLMTLR